MLRYMSLSVIVLVLVASGVAVAQEKSVAPKAATPKAAKAAAPVAPKAFEPTGQNYVANASFETWQDGAPLTWNIATGAGETWTPVTSKQDADAREGKVSLSVPAPKAGESTVIAQTIGTGKLKLKHEYRIRVSASVKTSAKKSVHLVLSYKQGDKEQKIRRIAAGGGKWEELRHELWIPKDADLESFRLSITCMPGAEGKVLVDDVKIQRVVPAKPAPATPEAAPVAVAPKVPAHGVKTK